MPVPTAPQASHVPGWLGLHGMWQRPATQVKPAWQGELALHAWRVPPPLVGTHVWSTVASCAQAWFEPHEEGLPGQALHTPPALEAPQHARQNPTLEPPT